ncbi:hypothetical protein ACH5RR_009345 [Cinchona calisaya]|uniref:Receptor-like serine/threonine-protein kinase n=1 Tax=Cinchona calisaya TaxID=153742 RepID=A0ABD3AER8_9GENT
MAYASIHLIFFIFLFPIHALAQNNGTVAVGRIITANETSSPWLSPSEDFAFGFQRLKDCDMFLLSIWYNKIPDKTVVWYVNTIDPVPRGSKVELNSNFGLVLRGPQDEALWNSEFTSNQVDHGFLNDTGNFIIKGGSDKRWLWESFRLPTNTLLPFQELETGSRLISRQSETNFSRGRFYLRFRNDGNLVLATGSVLTNVDDDAMYYESKTSDPLNSGYRVIFNSKGTIFILKKNNETQILGPVSTSVSTSENYFRATIDFDGVFTMYYHPMFSTTNSKWSALWSMPDNICLSIKGERGSGACGFNSICSLTNDQKPNCECPERYVLLDPNNKYGSCIPNFTLSCAQVEPNSTDEEVYDLTVHDDVGWPSASDYEIINPSNESFCRQSCLQDCLCAVAIFRNDSCWKKKLPLSNGRVDIKLKGRAFIKYRKSDAPNFNPRSICPPVPPVQERWKDRITLILVGSVFLGSSLFVNLLLIGTTCFGRYLIFWKKKIMIHPNTNAVVETNLHCFAYKELVEATNGFKEELGKGACGVVYKGEWQKSSRKIIVAVKKLDRMPRDAEKEFRAEMNTIGQTNHKNLVRLFGFCDEGQHRLLVYEYMCNGNLASLLFCDKKPRWNLRSQIAIEIARGLVYLHDECSTQISHCDIKPQNILLDDHYNARISDFGLAKLLATNQSSTLSGIRGTKGYVAPEWYRETKITVKVDVYSFGVMLLEIISCRRKVDDIESGERANTILTDWAWDCFQEGRLDILVGNDFEALEDELKLERFVMVGIWCIQEDSTCRPTMRKVSQMLEGIVEVMVPPCPYPFSFTSQG